MGFLHFYVWNKTSVSFYRLQVSAWLSLSQSKAKSWCIWCNCVDSSNKSFSAVLPLLSGAPWCAPIKLKHGDVSCRTPRGEHSRNVMGTRCKIRCKRGYESQNSEVVCMASKHWSSNYACRGEKQWSTDHTQTGNKITNGTGGWLLANSFFNELRQISFRLKGRAEELYLKTECRKVCDLLGIHRLKYVIY